MMTGNAILDYRWVGCSLSEKSFVVVFLNKINYLVLKRTTISHLMLFRNQKQELCFHCTIIQ